MPTVLFDHEKLQADQEALRFVAWVEPLLARPPAKLSARDQLDRASTSIPLNLAEGNGKRSRPDLCRYLDIAEGKNLLLGLFSLVAVLIVRFSGELKEDAAEYGSGLVEKENE